MFIFCAFFQNGDSYFLSLFLPLYFLYRSNMFLLYRHPLTVNIPPHPSGLSYGVIQYFYFFLLCQPVPFPYISSGVIHSGKIQNEELNFVIKTAHFWWITLYILDFIGQWNTKKKNNFWLLFFYYYLIYDFNIEWNIEWRTSTQIKSVTLKCFT